MRRSARALAVVLCAAAVSLVACTTTYTEADLAAEEKKMDADARFEEMRDEKTAAEGGENREAIAEDVEEVEADSER